MTLECALWLAIAAGVVAILYGAISVLWILAQPAGNARMQEIAAATRRREGLFQIGSIPPSPWSGSSYSSSSASRWTGPPPAVPPRPSGATGYIAMLISVRANVRTAQAAHREGSTPRSKWRLAAPSPACWWWAWGCSGSPATTWS